MPGKLTYYLEKTKVIFLVCILYKISPMCIKDLTIKGKMLKRSNRGWKQWNLRVEKNFQSMTEGRNHKGKSGYLYI